METINQENLTYKGTRILLGNNKRKLLNDMIDVLYKKEFNEISIPVIQYQDTFANKVGEENNNLMFNFRDRGDRELCLAPEYTAVVQKLSNTVFKQQKDVKLFYIQECFRGEKPQAGRYRQFTQLGIEIINPTKEYIGELSTLASDLIAKVIPLYKQNIQIGVTRGLDYYKEETGFEISCEDLGSSKQICGGGAYEGGVGFAIGIDRLLILNNK
jgi:histidyl-tRNA synthetase